MELVMAKNYRLAPGVLAQAQKIGIYGDTAEARILHMAKLAARLTHPDATHRFRQHLLTIEQDGLVTMIDVMSVEENQYYSRRKYDDRRGDQEEVPPSDGEAIVTPKNRK
jgi:hypothetical protein